MVVTAKRRGRTMIFTQHAVERFIKRLRPDLDFHAARSLLNWHAKEAVRTKQKSLNGQSLWEIASLKCVLVVKYDLGEDKGPVCVTIMEEEECRERNGMGRLADYAWKNTHFPWEEEPPPPPVPKVDSDRFGLVTAADPAVAAELASAARLKKKHGVVGQKMHEEKVAKLERKLETQKAHAARMEEYRSRIQGYLRMLLQVVMDHPQAMTIEEVQERIATNDPGLLSEKFLSFDHREANGETT